MKIAVIIPCYNEEITVQKVVNDFRKELPEASIYVYDNNSTDKTYELAVQAGAIVKKEYTQGKGNVVCSSFRDIFADLYILVDGDDTYPPEEVHKLIEIAIEREADMVIGDRLSNGTYSQENKRKFHGFGNDIVRLLINRLFNSELNDIMTGYRVFSRRFVKCMPVMSKGFEIETEMTIFSLVHKMRVCEVPITYRDRPENSTSKLNTVTDGIKVIVTLFDLFKNYRPFLLFSVISLFFFIAGLIIGLPVLVEFIQVHFIFKIPSAVLSASMMIIAFMFFLIGIILDSIKNQSCINMQNRINMFIDQDNRVKQDGDN